MASTTFYFKSWSASGGAGDQNARIVVNWTYSGKTITITSISYSNNLRWYVASNMGLSIRWSDCSSDEGWNANGTLNNYGGHQNLATGGWNCCYVHGALNYCSTANGAGFVDVGGVSGVISEANRKCPVSHTFASNSGGFVVCFGSTLRTVNAGNPQNYRQLSYSGDTPSVQFAIPPSGASLVNTGITCDTLSMKASVTNTGIGSQFYQRVEYSLKESFPSGETYYTAYSTSNPYNVTLTELHPGRTYYVRTYAKNDVGGVNSKVVAMRTKGEAPKFGTSSASNPEPFRVIFNMSSINWDSGGCGGNSGVLTLHWSYTADGVTRNYSYTWSDMPESVSYDTGQLLPTESQYFTAVPDDETISYYWEATNAVDTTKSEMKTLYCQQSYTAYVIEQDYNGGQPVEAEMYVSASDGTQPTKKIRRIQEIGS